MGGAGGEGHGLITRRGRVSGVLRHRHAQRKPPMALIVSMDGSVTAVKADTGSKVRDRVCGMKIPASQLHVRTVSGAQGDLFCVVAFVFLSTPLGSSLASSLPGDTYVHMQLWSFDLNGPLLSSWQNESVFQENTIIPNTGDTTQPFQSWPSQALHTSVPRKREKKAKPSIHVHLQKSREGVPNSSCTPSSSSRAEPSHTQTAASSCSRATKLACRGSPSPCTSW